MDTAALEKPPGMKDRAVNAAGAAGAFNPIARTVKDDGEPE
jgi:hypothetical protein